MYLLNTIPIKIPEKSYLDINKMTFKYIRKEKEKKKKLEYPPPKKSWKGRKGGELMLLDFKTYKSAIRQCDIGGRIDTQVSGTE